MKNAENHNEPNLEIEGLPESDLKRNAFKTPEGYFDNLTPRIMESVRYTEKTKTAVVFDWKRILIPTLGMATAMLAAWFFFYPTNSNSLDFDTVLASLTIEELTEFADFETDELVIYELVDYNQMALAQTELSEEEIIEYLSEDDIELNIIIDEIEI